MKSRAIARHDAPHQFEPLMPSEAVLAPLLERAGDLVRKATALGTASGQAAQHELRRLLRSMNAYYNNRIEGDHTRPTNTGEATWTAAATSRRPGWWTVSGTPWTCASTRWSSWPANSTCKT